MMYDVCVIGGGLAGLSFALDMSARGYSVVLIEKGEYPRQKVCGEYISMESYYYLKDICPALAAIKVPVIREFQLSSTGTKVFRTTLGLGGFGISRYLLEELMFQEAFKRKVVVFTKTKAQRITTIEKSGGHQVDTGQQRIEARILIDSTGRKSNLNRSRLLPDINYVGVKYHVKLKRQSSLIELHNFQGGYCGISNVEDDVSCLCYMINSNLITGSSSIAQAEKQYLWQNRNIREIFENATFITKQPVTVSGINFSIKHSVTAEGVFNIGDSAGCIAPVTGNGMSMALKSAFILARACDRYFRGEITSTELKQFYCAEWKREFEMRIKLSRYFQKLAEFPILTNTTIRIFNVFPAIARYAINRTHGRPFGTEF